MSQYRQLLLICEPTGRPTPAFEHAGALAAASGAAAHLSLFDHSQAIAWVGHVDPNRMAQMRDQFVGERRGRARVLAEALSARGIRTTADAVWARPAYAGMLQKIEALRPDLVIKDAWDERPLLKRMLFTSTDWQLLRHCTVPLLLVRDHGKALPRRIVVAVDPSPFAPDSAEADDRIIHAALNLAIQSDAEVHLVFALDTMAELGPALAGPPGAFSADVLQSLLAAPTRAFDVLAEKHGVPADRRHLLQGAPGPAIAEFAARWDADVIVLGTAQRSGLQRWMLGSTAEQILDHAPCSVLAVPPGH